MLGKLPGLGGRRARHQQGHSEADPPGIAPPQALEAWPDDPFFTGYLAAAQLPGAVLSDAAARASQVPPEDRPEWTIGYRSHWELFGPNLSDFDSGYRCAGVRCVDNTFTTPEDAPRWAPRTPVVKDPAAWQDGFRSFWAARTIHRRPPVVLPGQQLTWITTPRRGTTVSVVEVRPGGTVVVATSSGARITADLGQFAGETNASTQENDS